MNVFEKMIDIIEERGLGKGKLIEQETGKCCVLGAYYLTENPEYYGEDDNEAYYKLNSDPVVRKMCQAIRPDWDYHLKQTIPVYGFSDQSSKGEVIDFLKRMSEKENV